MFRERSQPVLERLVRINDDFQFAIGQSPDGTWAFRGQRDFDPLAVQPKRVGNPKDPVDMWNDTTSSGMDTPLRGILDFSARSVNERMSSLRDHERFSCLMCQGRKTRGRRLAPQHTGKDLAGFFGHGTGDIQMCDGTKTVAADGINQEPLLF